MEIRTGEYYNLYVESNPIDENTDPVIFTLKVCDAQDIHSYHEFVIKSEFGKVELIDQEYNVVDPKKFVVYDFSNTKLNAQKNKKKKFLKVLDDNKLSIMAKMVVAY